MEKRALGKTGMNTSIITFGGIIVDKTEASEAANAVAPAYGQRVN